MAQLTVARSAIAGEDPAPQAANAGGDTVPNNGRTLLVIENGSGGAITVTVDSPQACSHGVEHDQDIVVAAGATVVAGPFDPKRFGSTLALTYSGVTSLTIAPVDTTPSY